MHRYLTPAEETESVLLGDDLEHALREGPLQLILREEKHTDTVVALVTQLDALHERRLLKEAVADLQEDADAVADLAARVLTGAVLELFHDMQCIVQDARILVAVDVHDAADSAGILGELIHVLEGLGTPECVVSPVLLWHSKGALILISIHIYSTKYGTKKSDREGTAHLVQSTEPSAVFVTPLSEQVLTVRRVHSAGTCSLNAQLCPLPAPISSAVRFYSEGSDTTKWSQILSFI